MTLIIQPIANNVYSYAITYLGLEVETFYTEEEAERGLQNKRRVFEMRAGNMIAKINSKKG